MNTYIIYINDQWLSKPRIKAEPLRLHPLVYCTISWKHDTIDNLFDETRFNGVSKNYYRELSICAVALKKKCEHRYKTKKNNILLCKRFNYVVLFSFV